jgi:nicotinamide mononucleotide transporter
VIVQSGVGDVLTNLANAQLTLGDQHILWREIAGNAFGLAGAIGGMRRRVWAWPVGMAGNVLLFTVFLGAAFHTPQGATLYGQAGRQVMFLLVAGYGWQRWRAARDRGGEAVTPRWATTRERAGMVAVAIVSVAVLTWLFGILGSYPPVWADAWTFTGSMLASYAMARGWVDFWLVWIGVDIVGVPLLIHAGYYPSATLYTVYGAFVVWGFTVWARATRDPLPAVRPDGVPITEEVGG